MQTVILIIVTTLLIPILRLYNTWRKRVQSIGDFPGYRLILSLTCEYGELFPPIPGFTCGYNMPWRRKFEDFKKWGSYGYATVSLWPRPIEICVADSGVIKDMLFHRAQWPKPVKSYRVLALYGQNVVTTEGDEWKKHRKVVGPAFSEPNNKLVCSETVKIMKSLFQDVWKGKDEISYDDATELMAAITLLTIGNAAFGRKDSWSDDLKTPPGHKMTFKESVQVVSTKLIPKLIIPDWSLYLHPTLRRIRDGFEDLPIYLQEMIHMRKTETNAEDNFDLLSRLVEASGQENNAAKLDDEEIIGNTFIFLLAGHETTSHTLAFSFALLALYPKEQDILYKRIMDVLSDGRDPTYNDLANLTQSLAVLYETMRLFPPVLEVPKEAANDTTITVGSPNGTSRVMLVPKGARINLSIVGLHYNPLYWENPDEFRPQRFNESWPRDAFLPFSGGARACLGRRFAETEAVVVLSMLVAKFKIEILEESKFSHETFEQRKERVLRARSAITTTPLRVPLVFKRRL